MHKDILDQQQQYYRARASEYDEWFMRQGRYDRGPELNARWFAEVEQVRAALAGFHPTGSVLELACGTGWWTEQLARFADDLTAVDAAPETLAINRARLGGQPVEYIQTDLFAWQPARHYDVVFFSFWLSHVPPERFADFWGLVRAALKPDGRWFFIDSLPADTSSATNHDAPDADAVVQRRKLNDGREFEIVKVYYAPDDLAQKLDALGWDATIHTTEHYFLYGSGNLSR
ncbi:MAG TPA: methyltransferase domain-containing protein [Roseiflexaceae bacterium]|jgi:demethylmenaquinone methyltransferase/2-methoxy-6-polyprenyl-1,4-benzoquinol methylase|nr:methyltransferase domain-containing protein [Roseiflexaceae bacterium]